jgi:hypothetical protein
MESQPVFSLPARGVSRRLVPNKFIHRPDGVTEIILEKRDGTKLVCLIDTQDYALVKGYRWSAYKDHHGKTHYVETNIRGDGSVNTSIAMHRILLPELDEIDHENGNGCDNRRSNLRAATHSQNVANRVKWKSSSSRFLGVYRRKDQKRFRAQITVRGTRINLGSFLSEDDAARGYDTKSREAFDEFARLNFPAAGEQAAV